MDLAAAERARLCDLLDDLGPDAPTLCEGWTTRDLAAHLVVREGQPLALPGIALPPLAPLTARLQARAATRPYGELVDAVRSGPPLLSPFRLPGVSEAANLGEFYVHHEDVRRPAGGGARTDTPELDAPLWARLRTSAWALTRHVRGAGIRLVRPDGDTIAARTAPGAPVVTVTGTPRELFLFLFGRTESAQVELDGDPAAVTALRASRLGL